ncbi:hypothetical protein DAMA08_049970 [Martiniozyma asiatica (nom. inval.)]|nr:hypothetical protein DAMA08_049970 [Martiniozyma asiatica]
MLRSITNNGLKQSTQRATKAFHSQPPSHQPRLFNFVDGRQFEYQQQRLLGNQTSTANNGQTPGQGQGPCQGQMPINYMPQTTMPVGGWQRQLAIFDECLAENSTYDLATGKVSGGAKKFWEAVKKIIPIYRSLVYSGELNEKRMSEFVSLLRNGLRIHRLELSKLKKNLDKDSNNPIKNIHYLLTCAIREVSYNVLDGLVMLNPHGLTHLFKAYKDLGFTYEAVHIWESGKKNPKLHQLFTSEPVLGSIFPFLVESGDFNFNEVWEMYSKIKESKSQGEKLHNELQVGMIRVCLFKNKTSDALGIFKQLTSDCYSTYESKGVEPPINIKSYMTMAHLSFIGFCKDMDTADYFFKDAVEESMPYLTPLQLNFIKKYLANTWEMTKDYNRVKNIWLTTWRHYESKKTSNSSVSSSLNDAFLTIFFQNYPTFTAESFKELQTIISQYASMRAIDEPFINVLLSKSTIWHNAQTFQHILQTSDLHPFSKTNVFYRCCLKACGSIDVPSISILGLFRQLLANNALNGTNYIAHADWVALRDATVNSPYLNSFESKNDRIDLYFKLWKLCAIKLISLDNLKSYIWKDCKLNQGYNLIFQKMDDVKVDLDVPELGWFRDNRGIEIYLENGWLRS